MPDKKTVIERLAEMAKLYCRCLDLTNEVLAEGALSEPDRLAELLQRRTGILTRIKHLEGGLETRAEDDGNYILGVPGSETAQARKLLHDLEIVIAELVTADRSLKERLEGEFEQVGAKLKRLRRGHSALTAYAPFQGGDAYFVDRRG